MTSDGREFWTGGAFRAVTACFGMLLFAIGGYIPLSGGQMEPYRIIGSIVLIAIGLNMIVAAYRGRRPWLSSLGPLP